MVSTRRANARRASNKRALRVGHILERKLDAKRRVRGHVRRGRAKNARRDLLCATDHEPVKHKDGTAHVLGGDPASHRGFVAAKTERVGGTTYLLTCRQCPDLAAALVGDDTVAVMQ